MKKEGEKDVFTLMLGWPGVCCPCNIKPVVAYSWPAELGGKASREEEENEKIEGGSKTLCLDLEMVLTQHSGSWLDT